ncbi:MAG: hypothetical protein L0228_03625 [Planctomycetes bacterium]|nr:hypothetical protein [Planctomycetota bacterium]
MNFNLLVSLAVVVCALGSGPSFAQSENHHYGLRYDLTLKPAEDRADVSLTVDDRVKGTIWEMRFHIDPARHAGFEGDGTIEAQGEYVTWTPPETGGRLSFHVPVSNRRANGRFDALMGDDWAVFRGDDLFPPAHIQDRDDSQADATLHVHLPEGWSFVAPYRRIEDHVYEIEHAHRRFDRPTGWMAAGRLGVRRDRIAGVQVVVAGPLNQGVRRLDILALLNWNLPKVRRLVPDHMPERLVVVSAGDPMWRGGLSGPNSLFLHADRPLLSENGSSTLVHELIHVATRIEGEKGADWIVEGMAEYYSLKILWRSGTITENRYQQTFDKLAKWGEEADRLDVELSRGPVTARAVGIMRKLDREVYRKTKGEKSLDDVVRNLTTAQQKVNTNRFRQAVVEVMGEPADALSDNQLGFDVTGN